MGFETPTPPEVQNGSNAIEQPKPDTEPNGVVQNTREKIATFFAFNQLKLREYFGKIDESQLQSLLELEFEQSKKDTPPISDVFDPEAELQNLKTLPREQKREALTEFKGKLARQREAWATCRTFLRRKIEVNHDVERQDLMDWIDKFSSEYGFTVSQRQTAEEIIDDYCANRQRVKDFRQEYQDNTELLTELTGISIEKTKKLDVSVGLMAIDIRCDGYTAGRLYERSNDPVIFEGSAFASYSNHQPPIKYNVFRVDTERKSSKPHEDQHQENKIFRKQFDQSQDESWSLWNQYQNEQDTETKRTLLESYLKANRDKALVRVKDELIAMKKPKNAGYPYDIWFKQDNSSYDYLSDIRDKEDSELYRECSQRLLVEEYRRIVESAVAAFDQLKKKGGYSIDQTIALLTDKPLTQWPKTARRLLEERQ